MTNDQLSPDAGIANQHSPSVSGIQNFIILSSLGVKFATANPSCGGPPHSKAPNASGRKNRADLY
jgi:hypothetical protein